MPVETTTTKCPRCESVLRMPKEWIGQTLRCTKCRTVFEARRRQPKPSASVPNVVASTNDDITSWGQADVPFEEFSAEGFPILPAPHSGPYVPYKSRAPWIAAAAVMLLLSIIAGIIVANREQL